MKIRHFVSCLFLFATISGCVTKVINSDGSVQSSVVDKVKLSDTYVNLALEYQKHGAPQVALDRVNLAIDTNSRNDRAYVVRAMIYEQLNKPADAENDFKSAISLNKNSSEAYVSYASFLCDQKRYDEAMKNYAIALDNPLYFTPEQGYLSRGRCYYSMKSYDAANADLMKSLTYRNIPQDSYLLLAKLQYEQNNFLVAKYYIDKFSATQTPASLWLHIQILQALLDSGVDASKAREYTSYRNTLARSLINSFSNSQEAQYCLIKYGQPSSMSNIPVRSSGSALPLIKPSTATQPKIAAKPTPLPFQPVSTSVNAVNNSDTDNNETIIVDNSDDTTVASTTLTTASNGVQTDATGRRYIMMPANITVYSLAQKYGLTVAQLEKYNQIKSAKIKKGMKLYIDPVGVNNKPAVATNPPVVKPMAAVNNSPSTSVMNNDQLVETIAGAVSSQPNNNLQKQNTPVSKPVANTTVSTASSASLSAVDSATVNTDANGRRYIIVPPKATAFSISKKFNLTVKQLEQYNRMKSAQVETGMKLYIDPAN